MTSKDNKKVKQVTKVEDEETKRIEDDKQKKELAKEKKIEENKELDERKKRQAEAGESAQKKLAKKKASTMLYYYISFGVLGSLMLYVVVMLFLNTTPALNKVPTIDDKRIEEHNQNFPWRQGPNKFYEVKFIKIKFREQHLQMLKN